mmetsp:Transcript_32971/g.78613  ORF Transcript_32971/g.78613 Transcript_32971/m.78613 type:complete len:279 (-) Transcript_32971:57-893(-)
MPWRGGRQRVCYARGVVVPGRARQIPRGTGCGKVVLLPVRVHVESVQSSREPRDFGAHFRHAVRVEDNLRRARHSVCAVNQADERGRCFEGCAPDEARRLIGRVVAQTNHARCQARASVSSRLRCQVVSASMNDERPSDCRVRKSLVDGGTCGVARGECSRVGGYSIGGVDVAEISDMARLICRASVICASWVVVPTCSCAVILAHDVAVSVNVKAMQTIGQVLDVGRDSNRSIHRLDDLRQAEDCWVSSSAADYRCQHLVSLRRMENERNRQQKRQR